MNKALSALLIALILVPSWVCAMQSCPQQVDAAEAMPCHGEMMPMEAMVEALAASTGAQTPMLVMDCLDLDLLQLDIPLRCAAEPSADDDVGPSFVALPYAQFLTVQIADVEHGPPPLVTALLNSPALYLSTQRLRI